MQIKETKLLKWANGDVKLLKGILKVEVALVPLPCMALILNWHEIRLYLSITIWLCKVLLIEVNNLPNNHVQSLDFCNMHLYYRQYASTHKNFAKFPRCSYSMEQLKTFTFSLTLCAKLTKTC